MYRRKAIVICGMRARMPAPTELACGHGSACGISGTTALLRVVLPVLAVTLCQGCATTTYAMRHDEGEPLQTVDAKSVTQIASKIFPQITPPLDSPFQVLVAKLPSYPATLRSANVEGAVDVNFHIASDGTVDDAKIVGSPPAALANICLEAIREWRFSQLRRNGKAVSLWAHYQFLFRLK
jgi:TonB family protein